MIALVNARFVPVWVNIRVEPVPARAAIDQAIEGIPLDERRKVSAGFNKSFFLRSVVLTSDSATLLNPQDKPELGHLFRQGHFPYAQVKAEDYLAMLELALERER